MFSKTVHHTQPSAKRERLGKEEYKALKARLLAKKKLLQNFPLFKPILAGNTASLAMQKDLRIPITIKDVQDLIINSVSGEARHLNRWFLVLQQKKISQTTVLVVDNVSVNDIEENQEFFPRTLELFDSGVEVINPNSGGLGLSVALGYSPITNALKFSMRATYNSLKEALDDGEVYSVVNFLERSFQGEETKVTNGENLKENVIEDNKGCTKTQLLLSPLQLITGSYPFPGHAAIKEYRFTKDKYEPVTDDSPMIAVDCEWCTCVDGTQGLARVAVIDENLNPIYHTYLLPDKPIRDYDTKWSGITPELLRGVQKRLCDVQEDIRKLLPPDAILVGHSISADLHALELFHPYIIDTTVIFNTTGCRFIKSSLQFMSRLFCNRNIQLSSRGHDPNEDALATMELALLKLKKGLNYGDLTRTRAGFWEGPSKEKMLDVVSGSIFGHTTFMKGDGTANLDVQDILLMKFFKFVQSYDKTAILITDPECAKIYQPKKMIHGRLFNNYVDPVKIVHQSELEKIAMTLESEQDKDLVFIHTNVTKEEKSKQHLKNLDQLIADLHEKMPMCGMMIVIFGGKTSPMENGVCMSSVKKPRKEDLFREHLLNE